jgi:hypothetical protein
MSDPPFQKAMEAHVIYTSASGVADPTIRSVILVAGVGQQPEIQQISIQMKVSARNRTKVSTRNRLKVSTRNRMKASTRDRMKVSTRGRMKVSMRNRMKISTRNQMLNDD